MILEKRLVLFVLLLYFPCSLCDDNASHQEATNSTPHKKWNSGSMEKLKSNIYYNFVSTMRSTNLENDSDFADSRGTSVSYNPESTESYVSRASPESTESPASSTRVSGSTENTANIVNDFGSTNSFENSVSYQFESTRDLTSYASDDSGSTRHFTSLATPEPGSKKNPTSIRSNSAFTGSLESNVSYNSKSTENLMSLTSADPGSTKSFTSFTSTSGLTGSLGSSVSYNPKSTKKLRVRLPTYSELEIPTSFASDSEFTDSVGSNVSYNSKSAKNSASYVSGDPGFTARYPTSLNTDSGSTKNLTTNNSIAEESTIRYEVMSGFTSNNESASSISDITQNTLSNLATVSDISSIDNIINTTTDPMICDPVNANVINLETEKGADWIMLTWECANDTYLIKNCENVTYSVERCKGENCSLTNESDTSHNATDLEQCTEYTFIVKVYKEDCESEGVSLTETTNNIPEIGDILDLNVRNISVKTIQLAWQAPVVYAKCISNYSIAQCDGNSSCIETTVVTTNYTANDLHPCTEYHFTIKTVTQTVQSTGVNETAKTASPKLSMPESVQITPGNFSLNVKWEPPKSDANCIKHYHVSENSDKPRFTFNTTDTSLLIQNLRACATYEVQINAVNEDDVHGETATRSSTTNPYKTNRPTPLLPLPSPHANNITIIWSINKENNDCPLSAIFTVCNHTETKGKGVDPVDNLSSTNVAEENVNKSTFTMNTTVSDLSPFTNYICWGYIISIGDFHSNWSEEVSITTLEAAPHPPTFTIKKNDSEFSLTWEFPKYIPGILEECDIMINWEPCNSIPDWCASDEPSNIPVNCSLNKFTYHFPVKAFTIYKIKMRAKTKAVEWSDYSEQNVVSKSTVPGAVTKFNSSSITIKENLKNPNILETILTWGMPCSLNGEFEFFNISIHGTRNGFPPHSFFKKHNCTNYIQHNQMCSITLSEEDEFYLKGEFNYTFTISTKVKNIDILGQETSQSVEYPPGIPPQPKDEYINMITSGLQVRHKTTTTTVIFLPLFPNDNGNIKYYAIMVSKKGNNERSSRRFDLGKNKWPNTSSWKEAMMSEFATTYQATRRKWDPYEEKHIVDYDGKNNNVIKYEIGVDAYCKEFLSNMNQWLYCNGPLIPDMWYDVRVRAFTYGGYADSVAFPIKTNAELNIVLVIGAVFSILLMGILVTMMLLVRKCSPYILLRRLLHSDMPGSPVPAPFTRKKFINHCQELVDNPGKLSNEFRLLQTLSVDLQMPTNTACLQANRKKNRYSDILPYDFSRVKLEVIDNDPNTDYINASFIRGYSGEDEYIACQGPKEETTYDFWRMVDQYNINIIVMLTQLVEKGKEKCHQYYPTIRETFRYENMTIRCTSELDFRTHTQRTLVLQKENKKRNITHLHFKDWPDHDVPEDFDAMINFCQIMRRNISANKDFIVVHCSAGIGRTGTLIAIDILLQHLRDDRKLDVFGTVYRLRHNRINMVQRESQYAYIYNCIKQVLKNPYFLKTCKPPPVSPVYQNISKKAKEATNSDNNLVNNLELLKKYNSSISMESLESIYNLFPWSTARNTINSGLRHYKSMGAINVKTHHVALGRSRTLDRVFYKSQKDSSCDINVEGLQESFPLLTCSRSADVLGDSTQYATNKTCERDD